MEEADRAAVLACLASGTIAAPNFEAVAACARAVLLFSTETTTTTREQLVAAAPEQLKLFEQLARSLLSAEVRAFAAVAAPSLHPVWVLAESSSTRVRVLLRGVTDGTLLVSDSSAVDFVQRAHRGGVRDLLAFFVACANAGTKHVIDDDILAAASDASLAEPEKEYPPCAEELCALFRTVEGLVVPAAAAFADQAVLFAQVPDDSWSVDQLHTHVRTLYGLLERLLQAHMRPSVAALIPFQECPHDQNPIGTAGIALFVMRDVLPKVNDIGLLNACLATARRRHLCILTGCTLTFSVAAALYKACHDGKCAAWAVPEFAHGLHALLQSCGRELPMLSAERV